MKASRSLLWAGCFIFILGCGQMIQNIPAITGAGSSAYVGYDEVVNIISGHLDVYSDQEVEALGKANRELTAARLELERLAAGESSLAEMAMRLPELMPLYNSMKRSYTVAYGIVISKIDVYDSQETAILLEYNQTCERLDQAITEAMRSSDGSNNEQIVKDVLSFAGLVAKIVIPLLIV